MNEELTMNMICSKMFFFFFFSNLGCLSSLELGTKYLDTLLKSGYTVTGDLVVAFQPTTLDHAMM